MPAEISVTPVDERVARIEQTQPSDRTYRVPFKGRHIDPQTISIPLGLPIYRVANMRTSVRQRSYVASHKLSEDYFSSGQEDPSVQRAQHTILAELAKDPGADIYGRLQKTGQQSEPLVVTAQGVVLNGNRRLAAMRDLFADQPQQYASFAHLEAVVLPADATEDDLTETETELQIAPELKLAYGWVEEALGLQRQLDVLQWPIEKAVVSWNVRERDLRDRLDHLRLGDEYLTAYLGAPGDYTQLASHEQAFSTLSDKQQAALRGGASPSRLEAERYVVYAVLNNPVAVRAYEYAQYSSEITTKILPLCEALVPAGPKTSAEPADGDPLAGLEAPSSDAGVREEILDYLKDGANGEEVGRMAQEALEEVKMERRVAKRGAAAAEAARRINSAALGMAISTMDPETAGPTAAQLVAGILASVSKLKELLSAHPGATTALDNERLSSSIDLLTEIKGLVEQG